MAKLPAALAVFRIALFPSQYPRLTPADAIRRRSLVCRSRRDSFSRNGSFDPGPLHGVGNELERPAHQINSFLHARQSQPCSLLALAGDTNTVINDLQTNPVAAALQFDRSFAGETVAGNVAQGFLSHA